MKLKILFTLCCCFFLTGCWNYRELSELSISTGMSIDKEGDEYRVGMLVSNAQKIQGNSKEGESQTIVLDGKGKTILEALKNIGLTSPKELYFRHLLVVVISEDVAKEGLYDVLDYLLRDSQSRKTFYMILAHDCKAKDTLKILSPLEAFPSQSIAINIEETYRLQAIMTKITYNSFLSTLLEEGKENYVNNVTVEGSVKKGEKEDDLKQTEPDSSIKMGTAGIFKNDKLLGFSTKDENRGINLLNNQIDQMYTIFDYHNSPISITIPKIGSDTKVKMKNKKPMIEVTIKGSGIINEVNQLINLEDPKVIKDLEKATEKELKKYTNKAIEMAQKKYQSDIFGYGSLIHKTYPKEWKKMKKNWNESEFPNLKIKVKFDIELEYKGSLKQSIKEAKHE